MDKKFVLGLILLSIFFVFLAVNYYAPVVEKTPVKNLFIDVNGDGLVDLLVTGEVIINNGTQNFPFQPTNSQP